MHERAAADIGELTLAQVVATGEGTIWVPFDGESFPESAAAQTAQPSVSVHVGWLARLRFPRRWGAGSGIYCSG